MKKYLLVIISSFLIITLTACAEKAGDIKKEIVSNIITPSPVINGICNSNEVENKEVSDEILREHVLCLIDKEEYSKVEQVIVAHSKQDNKFFDAFKSYVSLMLFEPSMNELDKYRNEHLVVFSKILKLGADNSISSNRMNAMLDNLKKHLLERSDTAIAKNNEENGYFDPKIGMTTEKLLQSKKWGKPSDINKTTTKYGVSEQWVYSRGYVYLEDGIVTSIQE
jgi:hypothetical protein